MTEVRFVKLRKGRVGPKTRFREQDVKVGQRIETL